MATRLPSISGPSGYLLVPLREGADFTLYRGRQNDNSSSVLAVTLAGERASASLQQDLEDPKSLLVYEVWRETPESFMKNQMTKEYRKNFEQAIVDLKVDRTPSWYTSLAGWKKA